MEEVTRVYKADQCCQEPPVADSPDQHRPVAPVATANKTPEARLPHLASNDTATFNHRSYSKLSLIKAVQETERAGILTGALP